LGRSRASLSGFGLPFQPGRHLDSQILQKRVLLVIAELRQGAHIPTGSVPGHRARICPPVFGAGHGLRDLPWPRAGAWL